MMILGLYFYAGKSSLTLLKDGEILFSIREEAISRKVGDSSFPELALEEVLKRYKITIEEIDHIVVAFKPIRRFEHFIFSELKSWPKKIIGFPNRLNTLLLNQFNLIKKIQNFIGHKKDIMFVDTNLSLAAVIHFCNLPPKPVTIQTEKYAFTFEFKDQKIEVGKAHSSSQTEKIPEELASLGATLVIWKNYYKNDLPSFDPDLRYGPLFEQSEIDHYLKSLNIPWINISDFPFEKMVEEGRNIGVFEGKMGLASSCLKGRFIQTKKEIKPLKIANEPIASTYQDAWRCFLLSDLDYLILGNCVIEKSEIKKRQKIGL